MATEVLNPSTTLNPSSAPQTKLVPWDPSVKHPLKTPWTLYYEYHLTNNNRPPTQSWGDNIKPVYTFDTVEDFWRLYNNITPPSRLQMGCSYNLSRKELNRNGKILIIQKEENGL